MIIEVLFFLLLAIILAFSPKIIKDPRIGVALLTIALPFERIPSYEAPFLWGVTIRISQIVALLLILSLLIKFYKKSIKIKLGLEHLLLFLYLLVALASLFFAGNMERAIMVWLFTAFVLTVSITLSFIIKKKKDLDVLEKSLYWVTFFVTIFGIIQFIGSTLGLADDFVLLRSTYGETTKRLLGFPRVQAFALEPLYYANFLLIPFGLFLAKNFNGLKKKYSWIIFLVSINFILTFSRGIYFATIIAIIVASVFALKYSTYKKIFKNFLIIGAGIVVGITLLLASSYYRNNGFSQVEKAAKHATEVNKNSISVAERKDTWDNAIEAFRQNPIIGVGVGNFGPWEVDFPEETPKGGWNIVNNESLEILAETGAVGFLTILSALFYIFMQAFSVFNASSDKGLRIWSAGLLTAFIGIAVQYQTFSTLYIMHVWFLIGLLMVLPKIKGANNKH